MRIGGGTKLVVMALVLVLAAGYFWRRHLSQLERGNYDPGAAESAIKNAERDLAERTLIKHTGPLATGWYLVWTKKAEADLKVPGMNGDVISGPFLTLDGCDKEEENRAVASTYGPGSPTLQTTLSWYDCRHAKP
jgi:hypothetical protein